MQKANWEKVFSQLRGEYVSLAVNVLTNSPKILVGSKYDESAVVHISAGFGTVYHAACCRVFWNETF